MGRTTKLHDLLDGVAVWTEGLRATTFKYLDAHCGVIQVTLLAELSNNELLADHVWGARKDVLRSVLDQSSPIAVLNAWYVIQRQDRDQASKPSSILVR